MKEIAILIQPVGDVNAEDVEYLTETIPSRFPFKLKIYPYLWSLQPPFNSYDINRMQYNAEAINNFISIYHKEFLRDEGNYVLGIAGLDGYYNDLNFVFGLTNIELKVATIYLKRLKATDSLLTYRERILKESVHELGHLFGLKHCNSYKCVMNFSNSLHEVDEKGSEFCNKCKSDLLRFYEII